MPCVPCAFAIPPALEALGWGAAVGGAGLFAYETKKHADRNRAASKSTAKTGAQSDTCVDCENCPVCGQPRKGNSEPGWDNGKEIPKAEQTSYAGKGTPVKGRSMKGARIFEASKAQANANGGQKYFHMDTAHKTAPEVEAYDKTGEHLGAFCALCGQKVKDGKAAYSRTFRKKMGMGQGG